MRDSPWAVVYHCLIATPSHFLRHFALPLLLICTGAVYIPSLFGAEYLTWDDWSLFAGNPRILTFSPSIFWSFDPELYVPFTLLTFQAEYAMAGAVPLVSKSISLFLHLINVALVFFLIRRLADSVRIAAISALLFGIHPLGVEAVSWVSARKDLLSTAFGLGSVLLWLQWRTERSERLWVMSLLCFACALLSKISMVTIPVLILLLEWHEESGIDRYHMRRLAPFFIVSILLGTVAVIGKADQVSALSPLTSVFAASEGFLYLLWRIFLPLNLSILYLSSSSVLIGVFSLIISIVVALSPLFLWRHSRTVSLWLSVFLIFFLPNAAELPKGGGLSLASDKYAYPAMVGILWLAAHLFDVCHSSPRASVHQCSRVALGALVLFLSWQTVHQSLLWRENITLYQQAIAVAPDSAKMHFNLGDAYHSQGEFAHAENEYRQTITLDPLHVTAYMNLGVIQMDRGDVQAAIALLQRALEIQPDHIMVLRNLGAAYGKAGRYEEGVDVLLRAEEIEKAGKQ